MLGLLPQQSASSVQLIPASQPLFPDCLPHPLAKRSEYGGFCMPTRDAKNRFAAVKCAFMTVLSLKLLSAFPKERISLSGKKKKKDVFLGFRAIMRRCYCHVPVSARRESCFVVVVTSLTSSYFPFQLDNGFLYYFPSEFSTNGQLQKQLPLGWEITPGDDPSVEMHLHRAVSSDSWLVLADGSGISGPPPDTPIVHQPQHMRPGRGGLMAPHYPGMGHLARARPVVRAPGGTFAIEQRGHVVIVTDTSTNVGVQNDQTPIMFRPFSRHTPAESAMYSSHMNSKINTVASAVEAVGNVSGFQSFGQSNPMAWDQFVNKFMRSRPLVCRGPRVVSPPMVPPPRQFALLLRKKA